MLRVEDIGELAFGGLVTATEWYDKQRIDDGKLTEKDILKKFSTYAYLIPGGAATIMSAFGVWRGMERWNEHISHGFMYDFPRFLKNVVTAMRQGGGAGARAQSVREANRIIQETQRQQLTGGRTTDRSYQREFESVAPHAF